MLIRVNKTTNEIDNSIIIPQLQGFEDIELKNGFEWVELDSEWYINYETELIKFNKEIDNLEFEFKAENLELSDKEMIKYLTNKNKKLNINKLDKKDRPKRYVLFFILLNLKNSHIKFLFDRSVVRCFNSHRNPSSGF